VLKSLGKWQKESSILRPTYHHFIYIKFNHYNSISYDKLSYIWIEIELTNTFI
jgi:hypothetical protein